MRRVPVINFLVGLKEGRKRQEEDREREGRRGEEKDDRREEVPSLGEAAIGVAWERWNDRTRAVPMSEELWCSC